MEDRVDRVPVEADRALDVVQERSRPERELENVVQPLGAITHPEHVSELAKPSPGQAVATRQPHVLRLDLIVQPADPLPVGGIAIEIQAVAPEHARVGVRVDLVDVAPERPETPVMRASRKASGASDRYVVTQKPPKL
jgi:hypothetical protein